MWVTLVPPGHEAKAEVGVPIGPPDTSPLGLPEELDIRLNNQLARRGLITRDDLRNRSMELFAVLQAVYKVDMATLAGCYREE